MAAESRSREQTAQESESRPLRVRMTGEGYEYVSDQDPRSGRETPAYIHRLCVVAWSEAETVTEAMAEVAGHDVHHEVPVGWLTPEELVEPGSDRSIPWLNVEAALRPVEWSEHRKMTLALRSME